LSSTLEAKRLELLHELMPQAEMVGILLNPDFPLAVSQSSDLERAARALGLKLRVLRASTDREIDIAFVRAMSRRCSASVLGGSVRPRVCNVLQALRRSSDGL
jgi:putative tryptophan/tyrosine transport system substrate-binding protein